MGMSSVSAAGVKEYNHVFASRFCYFPRILVSYFLVLPALANPVAERTLVVSNLPFSSKLRNPCALANEGQEQGSLVATTTASVESLLEEIRSSSIDLKDSAQKIIATKVIRDCPSLVLPSVAVIPSIDQLEDESVSDVLRLFYTSVLNHTAYVYYISDQLQRHDPSYTCGINSLADDTRKLAAHMRQFMCFLRVSASALRANATQDEQEEIDDAFTVPTTQILDEQLLDQPLCSRRNVRDCQTLVSTRNLFERFAHYLQREIDARNSSKNSAEIAAEAS